MRALLAGALIAVAACGATTSTSSPVKIADVAMKGDMDALRSLVKQHPSDVNTPLPDGGTALLWAAYWNDDAVVDALIAAYPLNKLEIEKMYAVPEARYEEPCVVFSAIP